MQTLQTGRRTRIIQALGEKLLRQIGKECPFTEGSLVNKANSMTQNTPFDLQDDNAKEVERLEKRRQAKPRARARKTDPESSHHAALRFEKSTAANCQRQEVTDLVYQHPGKTSKELAALSESMDRHQVARRLPEAEDGRWIKRKEEQGKELTWWPRSQEDS